MKVARSVYERGVHAGPEPALLGRLACAMEIVALAFRLEPDVWRLLKNDSGKQLIDTTKHARDELGAGILLKCGHVGHIRSAMAGLLSGNAAWPSVLGATFLGFYWESKKQLEAMTTKASLSLSEYQIPLAIDVEYVRKEGVTMAQIVTMFDTIVATRNVATAIAPHRQYLKQPRYRLANVFVDSCTVTRSAMAALDALGVSVTSIGDAAHMGYESLKELMAVPSSPGSLMAANVKVDDEDEQTSLHTLLSFGQHLGSLKVETRDVQRVDVGDLVRVLLHTRSKWVGALHDLRIEVSETVYTQSVKRVEDAIASALDNSLRFVRLRKTIPESLIEGAEFPLIASDTDEALVLLPDGGTKRVALDAVEPCDHTNAEETSAPEPTSSIESFSCVVPVDGRLVTLRVLRLFQRFLPSSLKTLALDMSCLYDECVTLLLGSFPQLETLRLTKHHLATVEPLVDAFRKHSCQIQALELGGSHKIAIGLLTILSNPTIRIAKQPQPPGARHARVRRSRALPECDRR